MSYEANKNILIVDDEPDIIEILSFHLDSFGWNTYTTTSPISVLELVKKREFFLIITDIAMPEMDGYELITSLKKENINSKIMLMTGFGYNPRHTLVKINKENSYPLIFKPFEFQNGIVRNKVMEVWENYIKTEGKVLAESN